MMNPKLMARKKAMEAMMKEGPMLKIEVKKKGMMPDSEPDMEDPMEAMEGDEEEKGQGFEQMMVTPEEKKMILEMRKGEKPSMNKKPMMPEGDDLE